MTGSFDAIKRARELMAKHCDVIRRGDASEFGPWDYDCGEARWKEWRAAVEGLDALIAETECLMLCGIEAKFMPPSHD